MLFNSLVTCPVGEGVVQEESIRIAIKSRMSQNFIDVKFLQILLSAKDALDAASDMGVGDRAITFLEQFLWKNVTVDVTKTKEPTKSLQTNRLKPKIVAEVEVSGEDDNLP